MILRFFFGLAGTVREASPVCRMLGSLHPSFLMDAMNGGWNLGQTSRIYNGLPEANLGIDDDVLRLCRGATHNKRGKSDTLRLDFDAL